MMINAVVRLNGLMFKIFTFIMDYFHFFCILFKKNIYLCDCNTI